MKVLGIDPGLANTGWSIVEPKDKSKFFVYDKGTIKTKKDLDFSRRLCHIIDTLLEICLKNDIKYVSAEDIFFTKNISSAIEVAKVIGAFEYAFSSRGMKVFLYTPTAIKQAVAGGGKADKKMIEKMVLMQLSNPVRMFCDHECDSIAAAITFLIEIKSALIMEKA